MLANETPEKPVSRKLGNTNAMRTGNRTKRSGLALAALGQRYKGVYQALKLFRKTLEGQVRDSQGGLSLLAVGQCNECVRWEMAARLTQRLVADNPDMPPEQVVSSLNAIGNATRNRNAIMGRLLNGKASPVSDVWAALDADRLLVEQSDGPAAVATASNAIAGHQRDVVGIDAVTVAPTENQLDDAVEGPR